MTRAESAEPHAPRNDPALRAELTRLQLQVQGLQAREVQLQQSEQRYRALVEHIGEGMCVLRDGIVVFANLRAVEIIGQSPDGVLGSNFVQWLHPDDRAVAAGHTSLRPDYAPLQDHYELRVVDADGGIRWMDVRATAIPWQGMAATMCLFSDITPRKTMLQALRHSDERYRQAIKDLGEDVKHRKHLEEQLRTTLEERETILQHSMMGIAFLTPEGRFRWANGAMRAIFRVGDATLHNMMRLYCSRAQYRAVGAAIKACLAQGRSYQTELEMRRLDGNQFWALMSGKAVNPNNATQGTVWVVMDISERKALEAALERTSIEREAILNSTPVGISYNLNRHVVWVNDKYMEMTGYRREELVGQSSRILYESDAAYAAHGDEIAQALAQSNTYVSERSIRRRDGSSFWVVLTGRRVVADDPQAGVIWTLLDVTERRQAEEDIRAALRRQTELNALRSRFVAMTSHEFRTPLAVILSSAELLRHYSERMLPSDKTETLGNIETAVQRMTRMLERVLLIGKTDADMLEFSPAPLNLDALCRAVLAEVLAEHNEDGARVEYRFSLGNPTGLYDEKLLRHILGNLLSNALKYSPQGEPVHFEVSADNGDVLLTVADHGIGIPPNELNHLFESFHRASNVGNIPGTGLGLSIVKKSVELHSGSIEVVSQTGDDQNHGTRFVVRL